MKVSFWAEIRRLNEIEQLKDREIAVKLGCSRHMFGRALSTNQPIVSVFF